jgi:hypothetical protein
MGGVEVEGTAPTQTSRIEGSGATGDPTTENRRQELMMTQGMMTEAEAQSAIREDGVSEGSRDVFYLLDAGEITAEEFSTRLREAKSAAEQVIEGRYANRIEGDGERGVLRRDQRRDLRRAYIEGYYEGIEEGLLDREREAVRAFTIGARIRADENATEENQTRESQKRETQKRSVQTIRKQRAEIRRRIGIETEEVTTRGENRKDENAQEEALRLFLAGLSGKNLPASEISR